MGAAAALHGAHERARHPSPIGSASAGGSAVDLQRPAERMLRHGRPVWPREGEPRALGGYLPAELGEPLADPDYAGRLVATGYSCRTQAGIVDGVDLLHPAATAAAPREGRPATARSRARARQNARSPRITKSIDLTDSEEIP